MNGVPLPVNDGEFGQGRNDKGQREALNGKKPASVPMRAALGAANYAAEEGWFFT